MVNVSRYVRKTESAIHFQLHRNRLLFKLRYLNCMGVYKCDVVVVIKTHAHMHGVLILTLIASQNTCSVTRGFGATVCEVYSFVKF